ncbi:hypothetical protein L218DRAFT_910478 [Marasmius fiardii PR-910]|nr:hypothetical protein L218DRAFT_910478 [Marasmius fiardii PR-910]
MSSTDRFEGFEGIGSSMDRKWCGPVPPQTFLDTFLDVSKLPDSHLKKKPKLTQPRKKALRLAVTRSRNIQRDYDSDGCLELERLSCDPLMKVLKVFCPRLKLVETANSPENVMFAGDELPLNPDVTVYNASNPPPEGRTEIDLSRAEMFFDVSGKQGSDPFELLDVEADNPQVDGNRDVVSTYAGYILCNQFRTHCFGVMIFDGHVRLIRWDRGGATFSEAFHLWKSSFLMEFLWRYNWADGATRGHDPSVVPLDDKEEDGDGRRRASRTREILRMGEDETVYQFTIEDENDGKRYVFLGGKRSMQSVDPTPVGRSTRGFYVTTLEAVDLIGPMMDPSSHVHYLKETWRCADAADLEPEGKVYHRLRQARVPHVATILASGDAIGEWQETATVVMEKSEVEKYQHYFLVMKEVGRSLTKFKLEKELIGVMRDALEAHQKAYEMAHILHRDISEGNILIFGKRGLLIDWEFCKIFTVGIPTAPAADLTIGTWEFVSARILYQWRQKILHTLTDDLESFFYVLTWIVVQYPQDDPPDYATRDFLKRVYDESHRRDNDETYFGGEGKTRAFDCKWFTDITRYKHHGLRQLISVIESAFRTYYDVLDEEYDAFGWSHEQLVFFLEDEGISKEIVDAVRAKSDVTGETFIKMMDDGTLADTFRVSTAEVLDEMEIASLRLRHISEKYVKAKDDLSNLRDHKWMLRMFDEALECLDNHDSDDLERRVDCCVSSPAPSVLVESCVEEAVVEDSKEGTCSENTKIVSKSEVGASCDREVVQHDEGSFKTEPGPEEKSLSESEQSNPHDHPSVLNSKKRKKMSDGSGRDGADELERPTKCLRTRSPQADLQPDVSSFAEWAGRSRMSSVQLIQWQLNRRR